MKIIESCEGGGISNRHAAEEPSDIHTPFFTASAQQMAEHIRFVEAETVERLQSVMRHPRSLVRSSPNWRPPTKVLPALPQRVSLPGAPQLQIALSRYRVSPKVSSIMRMHGVNTQPAYLISVRITDPTGSSLSGFVAESWARTLVPPMSARAVHEVATNSSSTFYWLVDRDFMPLLSPASLFAEFASAA